MTEKNPPIPQNSEFFRRRSSCDQVKRPYLAWTAISDCPHSWRRWIASMAIEEIQATQSDIALEAYEGCGYALYGELSDAIFVWRAWGKT